jgi:hypothetical protein
MYVEKKASQPASQPGFEAFSGVNGLVKLLSLSSLFLSLYLMYLLC